MAKRVSDYKGFPGTVCEAIRDRAKTYERSEKAKNKASKDKKQAEELLKELGDKPTKEREHATSLYGEAVLAMQAANRAMSWASGEMVHLARNADDEKLFDDVQVKAKPPKPGKDEAQQEMGEDVDAGQD